MYRPLCTAEYREGFTECADCHVSLVPACEEAETGRLRLWKGDRQEKLNGILGALDESGLPSYCKEIVNAVSNIKIMGIPIGPQRSTFEYEVWIFRSDREKAHMAIAQVLHGESDFG